MTRLGLHSRAQNQRLVPKVAGPPVGPHGLPRQVGSRVEQAGPIGRKRPVRPSAMLLPWRTFCVAWW